MPNLKETWGAMEITGTGEGVTTSCVVWRIAAPFDTYVIVKNYSIPVEQGADRGDPREDDELAATGDQDLVANICLDSQAPVHPRYRKSTKLAPDLQSTSCGIYDGLTGYAWTIDSIQGTSITVQDAIGAWIYGGKVGTATAEYWCGYPLVIDSSTSGFTAYDANGNFIYWFGSNSQSFCPNNR